MEDRKIKVFISSPMDVREERELANRAIDQLGKELKKYVTVETYRYEYTPMLVTKDYQAQIAKPNETDIFICILWSRLGTPLPSNYMKDDGSTYISGTEYEFEHAYEGYCKNGKPFCLIFLKKEKFETANEEQKKQKKALDGFIDKFTKNPDGTIKGALNEFYSSEEFYAMLLKKLRKLIVGRFILNDSSISATEREWFDNPFRGLESFKFEHSSIFFGRDREIDEVRNVMVAQDLKGKAFTLILGMSGSGKSSLAAAGLLPKLTVKGYIPGKSFSRQCRFSPGDNPADMFLGFAQMLLCEGSCPELCDSGTDEHELAALLYTEPKKASDRIVKVLEYQDAKYGMNEKYMLAIFIDQMEELFTEEGMDAEKLEKFTRMMYEFAVCGRVWIIATMRSDFYHRLSGIPELLELKEGGVYDLLPPNIVEIGEIIRYPALKAGLTFGINERTGEYLDDILLEESARDTSSLPLLEFTLEQLYLKSGINENGRRELSFKAYEEIGGMEGALQKHADSTLAGLPDEVRTEFPAVFRALAAYKEEGSSGFVARREAVDVIASTTERRKLVEAFTSVRLLVGGRDRDGNATVRVAHEAILKCWPRLKKVLDEGRDFLRIRENIEHDMEQWEKIGKLNDMLIPAGKKLMEADYIYKNYLKELNVRLLGYIELSSKKAKRSGRIRKILVAAAFLMVISFSLVFYTQLQIQKKTGNDLKISETSLKKSNIDLKQSNNEKESQRKTAQQNLALSLAGQSMLQTDSGDRMAGLLLAQESLSRKADISEVSVLKEIERALLYSIYSHVYQSSTVIYNTSPGKSLAYSPDGDKVLIVSEDMTVRVWSIKSGKFLCELNGKGTREFMVSAFINEGKHVITYSRNQGIEIWNAGNGEKLKSLNYNGRIESAIFSNNGKFAALISGNDNRLMLWNADIEEEITPTDFSGGFALADISSDGKKILMDSSNSDPQIYNLHNKKLITIMRNRGFVDHTALVFSPDGKRVAAGITDGSLDVWDIENDKLLYSVKGHSNQVTSVEYSHDGKRILTGSLDKTAVIWDAETGVKQAVLQGHSKGLTFADFSSDDRYIVTASSDNTVRIWGGSNGLKKILPEAGKGNQVVWDSILKNVYGMEIKWHKIEPEYFKALYTSFGMQKIMLKNEGNGILHTELENGGSRIIFSQGNGTAVIRDVKTAKTITLKGHSDAVFYSMFSQDGKLAATFSLDGTASVWNADDGRMISRIECAADKVWYAEFTSDGKSIATASNDGTCIVWDVNTGKPKIKLDSGQTCLYRTSFSPDGKKILASSIDILTNVCSMADGKKLYKPLEHIVGIGDLNDLICYAAFSRDGKYIVTASKNNRILAWDAETGKEIMSLLLETDESKNLTLLLQSGNQKVKCSYDTDERKWKDDKGQIVNQLKDIQPRDLIFNAEFSPDGSRFIRISTDGTLRLYDTMTGKSLTVLLDSTENFSDVTFSRDGKYIYVALMDGAVYEWENYNTIDQMAEAARKQLDGRILTDAERVRFFAGSD